MGRLQIPCNPNPPQAHLFVDLCKRFQNLALNQNLLYCPLGAKTWVGRSLQYYPGSARLPISGEAPGL